MRKFTRIIIAICVVSLLCTTQVFADEIKIKLNNNLLETDTEPIMENDRVLVPIRVIAEALKCDVSWNEEYSAITLFDGNDLTIMWLGRNIAFKTGGATINGHYIMDVTPKTMNDRTLVPVRAVSELLGAKVDWVDEENTVLIDFDKVLPDNLEGFIEQLNPIYIDGLSKMYDAYAGVVTGEGNFPVAEILLENGGKIEIRLYKDIAPKSVENFIALAKSGMYDGKIFHRVIKDFMIQGGALDKSGAQTEADNVTGEFLANDYLNLIPHDRGTISMARANNPDSGSNQFFIVHKDSPHLNGYYAGFGTVISGMEYVDKIAETQTDAQDKPVEDVVIKTVNILNE